MIIETIINQIKSHFNGDKFIDYILNNMFSIILAILIVVFYSKIIRYVMHKISKLFDRTFKDKGLKSFFQSITNIAIHFIFILFILSLLGVDFKGIFSILGAISIVLGFAFKETLGNVCGGLILLTFRPFKVGDLIEFKEFVGTVIKIEIFYTTLLNLQNEYVIVPNGNLINNEIRNININHYRRLDLKIGVSYNTNIKRVKEILEEIIAKRVDDLFYVEDEQPLIGMFEIGNYTLNFDVRVYVRPGMYLKARYYIYETVKARFDAENIVLPYNIIDVNMRGNINESK